MDSNVRPQNAGKHWGSAVVLALTLTTSCQSGRTSPTAATTQSASAAAPMASHKEANAPAQAQVTPGSQSVEPSALLTLDTSAYSAVLRVDTDAIYVLTSDTAYRIVPGQKPESMPVDLSFGATLSEDAIIYWSKGFVWSAPKLRGKPQRLGALAHQPQYFVTSGSRFAWIDRTEEGLFTLQTLERGKARAFYRSPGKIDALTMLHDWVFFVERATSDSWHIGGLPTRGGTPAFTDARHGRPPAMLTAADHIYYYDPDAQELRSLSPDSQRETTIAKQLVCSPMAVAVDIYCACVQGLFEVTRDSHRVIPLTDGGHRMITSIAANSKFVAWLSDTGPNKLTLMMLPAGSREISGSAP